MPSCLRTLGYSGTTGSASSFESFAKPWQWPTEADLLDWMRITAHPALTDVTTKVPALEIALAAAINRIAGETQMPVHPTTTDTAGVVTVDYLTLCEVPPEVHLATLMLAARWYRRPQSPDGVQGGAELQGVIATTGLDPEVELLLEEWAIPGIA